MATRTGLSTFLNLSHKLCGLFARYRGGIVSAINTSSASAEDKVKLLALMSAIDTACAAVDVIRITWES